MNNLRGRAGRALFWDLIGNYGSQIVGFIISIFLARLLEPAEFGLVGMSMVFINIIAVFIDVGLATALIQNKNNSALTYSSVFYLNIAFASILTVVMFFLATYVGQFYGSDVVTNIVRFICISFFISGFNLVQSSILKINLDFKNLTKRNLIAQVIAGVVAVSFAWSDFGVYALVIQIILAELIRTILLWKITDWYPKLEFSWDEIKKLFGFSLYVFAARVIGKIVRELDALVVGKLFSAAQLGFFTRSKSLNGLIIKNSSKSLTKVFFPVLSKLQDDPKKFESVYLRVINIVSAMAVLFSAVSFLAADELIIGLFGEKWEPSIVIFKFLIIRGFTYPISSVNVNAFLAKGMAKQDFHYGNIRKALVFLPLLIAYFYGFEAFLIAVAGTSIIGWILNQIFIHISVKITLFKQLKQSMYYLIIGLIIAVPLELLFSHELNYLSALIRVIMFCTLYFGGMYVFKMQFVVELVYLTKKVKVKLKPH